MIDSRKVMEEKQTPTQPVPFEEALTKTGNGLYNYLLGATCGLILLGIGMDLFGFSLVVAVACELNLTVTQKGVLTSIPFIGILLVSYVWGYISDTKGRRFTLVLSLQVGFVLSCLCCISPNWIFLGICKFLSVCFSCAANSVTYTLMGESCMLRVRSKYMLLMTCMILLSPSAAGIFTYPTLKLDFASEVPILGITFSPWRLLTIVLALPSGIGAIAIYFFYESPKFLANCGKIDEALEVLQGIHAINHRSSKDDFKVSCIKLEEESVKKQTTLLRSIYEQSAPLFRPPLLWRTLQLFYIIGVVYITNNSFLVWLAHILNLVRISLESKSTGSGNICALIADENVAKIIPDQSTSISSSNDTVYFNSTQIDPDVCLGTIDVNVMYTLIASQCVFAFLNLVISYLPRRRKTVLISVLCLSSMGGVCLNLVSEPVSSLFFFVLFTCTCLGMGIMASYFVELYPTSCRGMAACLSIMVGRTSTFVGINLVGNLIFHYCHLTFYFWSLLVLTSAVAAFFLPPDK